MEVNFLESQLLGVIIGSSIAGVFTLLAQVFATCRQKKQFAHDLEVRREQFSHEREQEIRGRRTVALADLQIRMEDQSTALVALWDFIKKPEVRPDLIIPPEDGWNVLQERGYRLNSWSTEDPVTKAIDEYATEIHMLLQYQSLGHPDVQALVEGKLEKLDEWRVTALDQQFQEASKTLAIARKETADLMSELNGIQVRKMTDQQVPVEEG